MSDARQRQTAIEFEARLEPAHQRRAIVQTSVHDDPQPVAAREWLWRSRGDAVTASPGRGAESDAVGCPHDARRRVVRRDVHHVPQQPSVSRRAAGVEHRDEGYPLRGSIVRVP